MPLKMDVVRIQSGPEELSQQGMTEQFPELYNPCGPTANQFKFLDAFEEVDKTPVKYDDTFKYEDSELLSDSASENSILKRDVDSRTISSVANAIKGLLSKEGLSKMSGNVYFYPITQKAIVCATHKGKHQPSYQNVECKYAPGKIICQVGKVTFVVNNGDHEMDKEVIERFIVMAYQRYGEGDDCFDVAVDDKETTACACYTTQPTMITTKAEIKVEPPPITVECNLLSNEKLKMCNPFYNPTEKIYQCKAKILGIKKRSAWHISVNDDGLVTFKDVPSSGQRSVRKKREFQWPQSEEQMFSERNRQIPRSRRYNYYFDQEEVTEETGLSNLYYHTKIPYVRNYTDTCTLQYQYYPWCPEYKSFFPCEVSKSDNITRKPCKRDSKDTADTPTSTLCTIEVTTEEALLKQTREHTNRRKRHKVYWRRRRRLQKPLKYNAKSLESNSFNEVRGANIFRNDRQFFADVGETTPQIPVTQANLTETQLLSSTIIPSNCPPNASVQESTISTTVNTATTTNQTTAALSASTQWCTITVPCNNTNTFSSCSNAATTTTQQQTAKTEPQEQKAKEYLVNPFQKGRFIQSQAQVTETNYIQMPPFANQPVQHLQDGEYLSAQVEQKPQEKFMQLPPFNILTPKDLLPKEVGRNGLRYPFRDYHDERHFRSPNGYSDGLLRQLYRPKRKIFFRKSPRFRRRQWSGWTNKQSPRFDIYDE